MSIDPNPSLKELTFLIGTWAVELVLPSDPTPKISGHVSFDWLEDGAFVLMRLPVETSGPSQSFWVIGRDNAAAGYTVLYYDTRGVSRVYQMRFEKGLWTMERQAPGFAQRYTGTISADQGVISGHWEKSAEGATWEHDFDVTYRRGA